MDQNTLEQLLALFQGKLNRPIQMYLETCARCGVCTPACHAYASIPLARDTPADRAEVVRRIYKKYFKAQGKVLPLLGQAKALDETALAELFEAAYSCTGCRRCMVYCPFGIDTQQIMSIAKLLLIGAQMEPETLTLLADVSISKGESIDEFKAGFMKGIEKLEKDVIEKWKSDPSRTPIPVDVDGADLLYVALAGAHSIIPAAAVFNAAQENWTLSFFEAVNFGASPSDTDRYANLRAESYWRVREALQPDGEVRLAIPGPFGKLCSELTSIEWSVNSSGKIIVEAKENIRKRLGRSPDHADALALSFGDVYDDWLVV